MKRYPCGNNWLVSTMVLSLSAWQCAAQTTTPRMTPPDVSPPGNRPRELGQIDWTRGFDVAAETAKHQHKPLLVLFQEVPGCHTCVAYGDQVLSHPLIVDAAESLFVPVAVYNNIKGRDERTLQSFKEPAWNNPVVRIVTHDRRPLAARVADEYTVRGIATAMVEALRKTNRDVPEYLELLVEELNARSRGLETATFVMHCFWEGESALGALPGVVSTMPGFVGKDEVVELGFDPNVISFGALFQKASSLKCADKVYARTDAQMELASTKLGDRAIRTEEVVRPDKQPKYYLLQTAYKHVPMTGLQAARVNALVQQDKDPNRCLSPSQIDLLNAIRKNPAAPWPDAIGKDDLATAWRAAQEVFRSLP